MSYGFGRFGNDSFASSRQRDFSELSPFFQLLNNQDSKRVFLFEATPYDSATAGEVAVRASLGLQIPILDAKFWDPSTLSVAVDSVVELSNSDDFEGESRTSFGNIVLNIGDGDHDALLNYFWDGRSVRVLMGGSGFAFAEYQEVYSGTASDITYAKNKLSIVLRNKAEFLRVPFQDTLYLGTGGLEGGADLTGVPKPTSWGSPKNISPILVDRVNLIYQYHDSQSNGVDAGYDGANALTFEGDVADIEATSVTAGKYKSQKTGGYIKLGAEPTKAFTADVQGDSTSSFVQTAADIIERAVTTRTVLTSGDINQQSIATVNLANSSNISIYNPQGTVLDFITEVMQSVGGNWLFSRTGELILIVFRLTTPVGEILERDIIPGPLLSKVRSPLPSWRRKIGYDKAWTVQGQNDVVAAASSSQKDFVSQEYRFTVDEDAGIQTKHILARTVEKKSFIDSLSDATTEVARQQTLFGTNRILIDLVAKKQQFLYRVGQTITVNYSRFGFPKNMVIVSIRENTKSSRTSFRLWG